MAVNEYTYGTLHGVERRAGWLVSDRKFTGHTSPTKSDVELALDQIAAEIHAKLAEAGYPVDTKADVESDAPRAAKWLEALNENGAAADLIQTFAIAGDPETDEKPSGYWKSKYEAGMKMIAGKFLNQLGLTYESGPSSLAVCTSVYDSDGNKKLPIFTRDVFDYPSSRSLTEE